MGHKRDHILSHSLFTIRHMGTVLRALWNSVLDEQSPSFIFPGPRLPGTKNRKCKTLIYTCNILNFLCLSHCFKFSSLWFYIFAISVFFISISKLTGIKKNTKLFKRKLAHSHKLHTIGKMICFTECIVTKSNFDEEWSHRTKRCTTFEHSPGSGNTIMCREIFTLEDDPDKISRPITGCLSLELVILNQCDN